MVYSVWWVRFYSIFFFLLLLLWQERLGDINLPHSLASFLPSRALDAWGQVRDNWTPWAQGRVDPCLGAASRLPSFSKTDLRWLLSKHSQAKNQKSAEWIYMLNLIFKCHLKMLNWVHNKILSEFAIFSSLKTSRVSLCTSLSLGFE